MSGQQFSANSRAERTSLASRLLPQVASESQGVAFSWHSLVPLLVIGLLIVGQILINRSIGAHQAVGSLLQFAAATIAALPVFARTLGSLFDDDAEAFADLLVSAAVFGALATGEFVAAAVVPLIMDLGHLLEQKSIQGTRAAIDGLQRLSAKTAIRITATSDGSKLEQTVACDQLKVGDLVAVRPGALIPADGVVQSGNSSVDESSVTGESVPRDVANGEDVYAGTMNLTGSITVTTTQVGEGTSIGAIAQLLQTAADSKAPIVKTIERYASLYIPGVVLLAAIVFFVTYDIRRVITVFVVSCPCALVLAGPAAMIAAVARSTRQGVLIKSTRFLESLAEANCIVFDKTGTLTEANLKVGDVVPSSNHSKSWLLENAAYAAAGSSHPVSQAICQATGRDSSRAADVTEVPGCGVECVVDGQTLRIGKTQWVAELCQSQIERPEHAGPVVGVAKDANFCGFILLEDSVRSEAEATITALRRNGIERCVLLTGDRKETAHKVASQLSIDHTISEALPQDKLAAVQAERAAGRKVITVGDGINDSLALASSDVGIVMGARGTDVAIESADVVLMASDLRRIVSTLQLARATRTTIWGNIVIAMVSGAVMLVLGATGLLGAISGALVHNLGTGLVLANSSRLLFFEHSAG